MNTERKRFESWAKSIWLSLSKGLEGDYNSRRTGIAYETWQHQAAIIADLQQQNKELREALLDLRDDYKHDSEQHKRIQWIIETATSKRGGE
jgi:hypothetical protein